MTRAGLAVALLFVACAHQSPAPSAQPAWTSSPERWGDVGSTGEFFVQQRLRFQAGQRSGSFDAVLQVACGTLTVVGLTPVGTPLFSIRQQGDRIETSSASGLSWPFPPELLLLDVHRAFLYPLAAPPPPDGLHVYDFQGLSVRETWRAGRLMERDVPASSTPEGGTIHLLYEDGLVPGTLPMRTQLRNEADGYSLLIESLDQRAISCSDENPASAQPNGEKRRPE